MLQAPTKGPARIRCQTGKHLGSVTGDVGGRGQAIPRGAIKLGQKSDRLGPQAIAL